jgi:hypothetical protein
MKAIDDEYKKCIPTGKRTQANLDNDNDANIDD